MSQIKNISDQNCISSKDHHHQGIKLFGRTIPLSHNQIPTNPQFKDCKSDHITKSKIESSVETNSEEQDQKVFKKPDKIIPCPRCKSMETKFCYFNNYNVNQPRHFCKNCQRYWTAGGSMRNVPIGAGRRKNKHLASQFRQIMASGEGARITSSSDEPSNGKVLTFCHNGDDSSLEGNVTELHAARSHPPQQCYPVVSWDPTQHSHQQFVVSNPSDSSQVQWLEAPILSVPTTVPIQFVQAASYWGCMPIWAAAQARGNVSVLPALGKHSREESEEGVLASSEASKNQIQGGLGFEFEKENSVYKKLAHSKIEGKDNVLYSSSPVLEANPAAISRSHSFQEST
ncbi:hypothetical protein CsatB_027731 [Cannabis sativa]